MSRFRSSSRNLDAFAEARAGEAITSAVHLAKRGRAERGKAPPCQPSPSRAPALAILFTQAGTSATLSRLASSVE